MRGALSVSFVLLLVSELKAYAVWSLGCVGVDWGI